MQVNRMAERPVGGGGAGEQVAPGQPRCMPEAEREDSDGGGAAVMTSSSRGVMVGGAGYLLACAIP